jgi:hypothetical protein
MADAEKRARAGNPDLTVEIETSRHIMPIVKCEVNSMIDPDGSGDRADSPGDVRNIRNSVISTRGVGGS